MGKNLKTGIIMSYISMFSGIVISLLYTPVMLKYLGQQQYGLYNMAASVISYLNLFDLGLGNAVVRYSTKYRISGQKEKTEYLYGMFLVLYLIIAGIIIFLGCILILNAESFFKVSTGATGVYELKIIMTIMIISLAIGFPGSVFCSIISSYEIFTFLKITGLVSTILNPIIMIPLLIMGYKAISVSCVALFLNCFLIVTNIFYTVKILKIRFRFGKIDFSLLREIASYSFFIFVGAIVDQLYWNTDKVVLGAVSGENMVAVYSIGSQIHTYYQQFSWAISNVYFPRVTTMITEKISHLELNNFFKKIGRIQYQVLFLILTGFYIFGKEFINWWSGPNYSEAYYIALIVITPATIPLIQNMGVHIIQAMNKHVFRSICYLFIAMLNAFTSFLVAPKFGGIGCAVCTAVSLVIGHGILMNCYYRFKIGINIVQFWKEIGKIFITFMPLVIVILIANLFFVTDSFVLLVIKIVIYAIIYFIYAYLLVMNNEEKSMVNSCIKRFQGIIQC